ncbi:MAG: putative beta-N-acetylglucosaminidase [Thermoleophilia bacterium]|nr:putative beta-N-acetylglucosaminidase [Thermoleophilia bacterium]
MLQRRAMLGAAIMAAAAFLATAASIPGGGGGARAAAAPAADRIAAEAAYDRMSDAERAGQLVMSAIPGTTLRARDARTLAATRLGGVILFGGNYRSRPQLRRLTRAVSAAVVASDATAPRPLVSIDQEGGVVKRIAALPPTRSHPQLGASDRIGVTRAEGRAAAAGLLDVGVHLNLAPVADLDLGRRVMRDRSFGAAPARVARHVRAFIEGSRSANGLTAVKHFPGFGGANVNSDDALAVITRSRAQLDTVDLVPFRAAAAAHVDSVMVSHAVYHGLDRRRPASTSPAAYRMLRREFGADAVAITDSLHAAGFRAAARVRPAGGCVSVVRAGADIALLTGSLADAVACRRLLVAAVADGTIAPARLRQAALRVLQLKVRAGLLPAVS